MNFLTLFQIELIKTTRRTAFWVTNGVFFLLAIIVLLVMTSGNVRVNEESTTFALPEGWSLMINNFFKVFSTFFLPTVLILISASEFTFKTARQNIIDGLSKEEFFSAKVLLTFALAFLYFLLYFIPVLLFGYFTKTDSALVETSMIRLSDLTLFGAFFTFLLGYGSIALFFSFLIRSSGAALGVSLLYLLGVEGVFRWILALKDSLRPATNYFPTAIFEDLLKPLRYDTEKAEKLTQQIATAREQLEQMKEAAPDQAKMMELSINNASQSLPNTSTTEAFLLAWGIIVLIFFVTYMIYKKRDL
ncbi:MAG: hypothetical protein SFU91_12760 [Chloroherpetonaceae bacterium]|nr:hypothetical protein [Chloroherpetonaceae bacterium]